MLLFFNYYLTLRSQYLFFFILLLYRKFLTTSIHYIIKFSLAHNHTKQKLKTKIIVFISVNENENKT